MCDPTGLVFAEVGAAILTQSANASAQKKFNKESFDTNKAAADANAVRNYVALQNRQKQEHEKANQAIESAHREAVSARGTSTVSNAESGVAGNSLAALDAEFLRTEAEYTSRTIRSQAYLDSQFGREYEGVRAGQEANIRSGIGPPVQGPDYLNIFVRGFSKAWKIKHQEQMDNNPDA